MVDGFRAMRPVGHDTGHGPGSPRSRAVRVVVSKRPWQDDVAKPPRAFRLHALALAALFLTGALPSFAAGTPQAAITVIGPERIVFDRTRDACDGDDVPDTAARAYRDRQGQVVLFASHFVNRALRGPSLDAVKPDCRVALRSARNADPARYDDASWIAATWTDDGTTVHTLIHHEYQAYSHPGRCTFKTYLACWYNTVLSRVSLDGGLSFPPSGNPAVVASAPFRQDVEQGRHRGFFNPSNIVSDGGYFYFLAATTGWPGQPFGACLFRTNALADPTSWRAFDGRAFTVAFPDPYRGGPAPVAACQPIAPFPAPVGGIVRHRTTGVWLAVFQARQDNEAFPQSGLYFAASNDLIVWSEPRLLLATPTLYDDPCTAKGRLLSYPALLDGTAATRNFEDAGDGADLFLVSLQVDDCVVTAARNLIKRAVAIKVWP